MKITAAIFVVVSTALQSATPSLGFQPPLASTPRGVRQQPFFSTLNEAEGGKPGAPLQPPPNSSSSSSSTTSPPPKVPAATTAADAASSTSPFSSATSALEDLKLPSSLQDLQMPAMLKNVQMPDMKSVLATLQDGGEFGSRGEVYVAGQFILIVAVAFGGGIPFLSEVIGLTGPLLLLAGSGGIVLSVSNLGTSLSPFATPNSQNDSVTTSGLYQYVRHPMYASLILTCTGWSLVTDSASRLVLTALLVALLQVKTQKEEESLTEKFPQAYPDYQAKVSGKFFPVEFYQDTKDKFLKN